MRDPITVVLAADSRYSKQLAVTVASISRAAAGRDHRIFILHDGYDPGAREPIRQVAADELELCWIDARWGPLERVHRPDHLSPATLFRLRIEELMPEELDRVIYLDTDVIVR